MRTQAHCCDNPMTMMMMIALKRQSAERSFIQRTCVDSGRKKNVIKFTFLRYIPSLCVDHCHRILIDIDRLRLSTCAAAEIGFVCCAVRHNDQKAGKQISSLS